MGSIGRHIDLAIGNPELNPGPLILDPVGFLNDSDYRIAPGAVVKAVIVGPHIDLPIANPELKRLCEKTNYKDF